MAIATLTHLFLITLYELLRNLMCPFTIGITAHIVFGAGPLTTTISFVCFVWGATVFTRWWHGANAPPYRIPQTMRPRVVYSMPGGVSCN